MLSLRTELAQRITAPALLRWFLPLVFGSFLAVLGIAMGWYYAVALVLVLPLAVLVLSRPFTGIILFIVAVPLIDIAPDSEMIYWLVQRILIILVFALTLILAFRLHRKEPLVRWKAPDTLAVIAVIYMLVQLFAQQGYQKWPLVHLGDQYLIPLLIYLSLRLSPPGEKDMNLLYWALLVLAVIQAAVGLLSLVAPQLLPYVWVKYAQDRVTGTLQNPNMYAIVQIFCGVFLYHAAMTAKSGLKRSLGLIVCFLCLVSVMISFERAAWLAGGIILIGLLFLYPRSMIKVFGAGALALVIFSSQAIAYYQNSVEERLYHMQPVYDRIVVTDAMFRMWLEKPLFGHGLGTLDRLITQYYRTVGEANIAFGLVTSHNTFLTILTELGIIAILLYLLPVIILFIRTLRSWRHLPDEGWRGRRFLGALWLSAFGYIIIANLLDMRFFPYGIGLWWLMIGLIANILIPLFPDAPAQPA